MTLLEVGKCAKKSIASLMGLTEVDKNSVLKDIIQSLDTNRNQLMSINEQDIKVAIDMGLSDAMIERLTITNQTIDGILLSLENIIQLPDPINRVIDTYAHQNGMIIKKVSVPLGVLGIIYESRPNVTIDAFALAFKSSNAVILKGGKEAVHSNQFLVDLVQKVLVKNNIDPYVIQLLKTTSRADTKQMMQCNEYIDVLIPRGSRALIKAVLENSTVPVIETGAGNCHVYIDKAASLQKALDITNNAKTSRPSVCNACETVLVHKEIAKDFLKSLGNLFKDRVIIYGDEVVQRVISYALPVTNVHFETEFNDYAVAVKVVDSLEEAISHINQYSTKHSESIVTEHDQTADTFLRSVDSAAVYHNVSTRFTDGFEFGFGAEIGISTQKLHVRGPMGLDALTTYKYIIFGEGQIR